MRSAEWKEFLMAECRMRNAEWKFRIPHFAFRIPHFPAILFRDQKPPDKRNQHERQTQ